MPARDKGIKFAAFMPEIYKRGGERSNQEFQREAFLAKMVFVNTLKQLESSPPAFQGILQSLGTGLVARLQYVFNDEASDAIRQHAEWVRTPINQFDVKDIEGSFDEATVADENGTELDAWLEQAMRSRHLHKKLAEFNDADYDVDRWRKDIINDLAYLKEIHEATIAARKASDRKFEHVVELLQGNLEAGKKTVVFTQSQRTAFYLQHQLESRLPKAGVRRIDSNVPQNIRAEILYSFCPLYNPNPGKLLSDPVQILICTDVLSEGVNMQQAECILNYDIHWNPVRLIQRIGRVDRRLDPANHPKGPHTISIINFVPPREIDTIIKLVSTIEGRRGIINKTVGLDQAFFSKDDPAGTLREFNAKVDGERTAVDAAHANYAKAIAQPDPAVTQIVEQLPDGAFGVWDKAPTAGVFAMYEMTATEKASETDREKFKSIIGKPMLAWDTATGIKTEAAEILDILSGTEKGAHSANPSDSEKLKESLTKIKTKINQGFRDIGLVASIQPRLVCWMEMRRAD